MSIQTGVPGGTCQRFIVFKGNVTAGLGILVPLGQTEIDDVDNVLVLAGAYEKVVWLDVPVEEAILMHVLYSLQLHK